ncbi:MAG: D-alanyl-D-alanine carboxypeptidase/D-alanyl-D-alanine-endopeptidase [Candidatus Eremiobacteraeota bacterium]|nr:D-alanyl-D-alanine carboxypeptidase/D-alanyl-D-alanine-endopeptidase [Candidatus Eremiobacteraeota bacterium]
MASIPAPKRSIAPVPPPLAWSEPDRARLRNDLREAFVPALAGATGWSFAVVDADGRTLYDDRAQRAVAPASTQKLIVAAAALDALGAGYRYHTMLAARDGIGPAGTIPGDLWLIGSGDPSLLSQDVRNGIGMLWRSGLRNVAGSVRVDVTALRGPGLNPHWERSDNGQDYAAPVSGISLDGNTVESQQNDEKVWTPIQDPARYAADQTSAMLRARGVSVRDRPGVAAAPLDAVVLWDHRSAPLPALETHMLFLSDNHYAEQLLRTVGGEIVGQPNDGGGVEAEEQFLQRSNIPIPGLRLYDGSGLSGDNRVAAITLARLLAQEEPAIYLLLPLGGRQGTLEDYDFTTALGRVRAKSGHLSDVAALAGYVTTLHHGRVAFTFMIDGSRGDPDAAIVRAVDRLAVF